MAEKLAFFPLCVSLAFHFAFRPRFSETSRTMDASCFTFHTPIGVNVETLRGRLKRGHASRLGRAVRRLREWAEANGEFAGT